MLWIVTKVPLSNTGDFNIKNPVVSVRPPAFLVCPGISCLGNSVCCPARRSPPSCPPCRLLFGTVLPYSPLYSGASVGPWCPPLMCLIVFQGTLSCRAFVRWAYYCSYWKPWRGARVVFFLLYRIGICTVLSIFLLRIHIGYCLLRCALVARSFFLYVATISCTLFALSILACSSHIHPVLLCFRRGILLFHFPSFAGFIVHWLSRSLS